MRFTGSSSYRLAVVAALIAVAGSSGAQITRKGSAYVFRAKYRKGQVLSYRISTVVIPIGLRENPRKQTILVPVVMKVLDVKNSVSQIRNEIGPWLLDGKSFRPKSIVTVHVDPLNQVVGKAPVDVPQFSAPLPKGPLKIGQTWSSTISTAGSTPQPLQVKATYKLQRIQPGSALVSITYSGGSSGRDAVKTSGQGTMTLRMADGTLQSMDVKQNVTLNSGTGAQTVIQVRRAA